MQRGDSGLLFSIPTEFTRRLQLPVHPTLLGEFLSRKSIPAHTRVISGRDERYELLETDYGISINRMSIINHGFFSDQHLPATLVYVNGEPRLCPMRDPSGILH
ncbi:hypothetical protein KW787_01050 [Candidatus Pacearchaeota archaeon]|nr:hypothetical protein [Candidatus Pacearchaeota archaeon]